MTDKLDDFVIRLQNRIYEEAMAAYGKNGFERWQNPVHRGTLENPDGYARVRGSCGDTMQIFLRFKDEKTVEAAFQTDGCATTTVCGSLTAELALGKSPDEIAQITGQTILEMLPGLPEGEKHCAFLAAETLQAALDQYMKKAIRKPLYPDGLEAGTGLRNVPQTDKK